MFPLRKVLMILAAFIMAFPGEEVAASTLHHTARSATQKVIKEEIAVNHIEISNPSALVVGGTTYISIEDTLDLLSRLGVNFSWTGSALSLSTIPKHPEAIPQLPPDTLANWAELAPIFGDYIRIYVNGVLIKRVYTKKYNDFTLHWSSMTGLSLPALMQVLRALGFENTWNGHVWDVVTQHGVLGFLAENRESDYFTAAQTLDGYQHKTAKILDDTAFWKRAYERLYVAAETGGSQMLQLVPNGDVGLTVYRQKGNVSPKTQWFVNSPDAQIIAVPTVKREGYATAQAYFFARLPGIYTIQAKTMGLYSIPLVIIVGLNRLSHYPLHLSAAASGIQPLPQTLPAISQKLGTDDFTYRPYTPQDGWLPIEGTTKPGTGSVIVYINDGPSGARGPFWDYQLPVQPNGRFGDMVRIPFTGDKLNVTMFTDLFHASDPIFGDNVTHGNRTDYVKAKYDVSNNVPTTPLQRSLYATAFMDFNMNDALVQTAETLFENAGSRASAVEAISNFAEEKTWLDLPAMAYGKDLKLRSANGTWNVPAGTSRDITYLTGAMLRSVGVPTQIGWGVLDGSSNNETWLSVDLGSERAMLGSNHIEFDPQLGSRVTYNDVTDVVLNEEFGSREFYDEHHSATGKTYTYYEGIY